MNIEAPGISEDFSQLLTAWHHAEEQAKIWSDREKELRVAIFGNAFKDPKPGTNKFKLPYGKTLVGDYRLNYTVDKPVLETLRNDAEALPIIDAVISYRPEVKGGAFRALTDNEKAIAAQFITEKPGTPGLEIKTYKR